jgi:predicted dehydrogenase
MRSGTITVKDVPAPTEAKRAGVIVRVHASLISAGTEKMKVDLARASLIDKARKRPDDVKKVIAEIKQQGFWSTYQRVMRKLDTPGPLGYSCAGEVIAVSEDVTDLKPGDRVACGGQGAYHSEVVSVQRNLCVKLPENVAYEEACYTTLGAIAMQGVRQADLRFGETVAVIGLGVVGQLSCAIAKAAGCVVIGIDLDDQHVALAKQHTAQHAFNRKEDLLEEKIKSITGGFGVDAILICAATDSNDPIDFSTRIARDRGKLIMVGVTGMNMPRDAFFVKELEFRLSRSYGPGRYEYDYEERGIDYPIGYVRWTERRNLGEFVRLVSAGHIRPSVLTTHTFTIDEADTAYGMIAGERKERYVGIVLTYPPSEETTPRITTREIKWIEPRKITGKPRVGFIGAGNFAQGFLLPTLQQNAEMMIVANQSGASASDAQTKFGFKKLTTDPMDVITSPNVDVVFIATRHGSHAELAAKALDAGKHVFVEKPAALSESEMSLIAQSFAKASERVGVKYMVGFNRRFSQLVRKTKDFYAGSTDPKMIFYRVNAGPLPATHWTQDMEEGGGRIIGEGCHFIDTAAYIIGDKLPKSVYARSISSGRNDVNDHDTVSITVDYEDGSVVTLMYLANGDKGLPKEEMQVFSAGRTAIMKNFTELELWKGASGKPEKISGSGKGHAEEVKTFLDSLSQAGEGPIPFDSIAATTLVTFAAKRSLATGEVIRF